MLFWCCCFAHNFGLDHHYIWLSLLHFCHLSWLFLISFSLLMRSLENNVRKISWILFPGTPPNVGIYYLVVYMSLSVLKFATSDFTWKQCFYSCKLASFFQVISPEKQQFARAPEHSFVIFTHFLESMLAKAYKLTFFMSFGLNINIEWSSTLTNCCFSGEITCDKFQYRNPHIYYSTFSEFSPFCFNSKFVCI